MAHKDAKNVMCPDCKSRDQLDTKLVIKWSQKNYYWWACPRYPLCRYTEPVTGRQMISNRFAGQEEKDRQILAGTYQGYMDMEDLYFQKTGEKV